MSASLVGSEMCIRDRYSLFVQYKDKLLYFAGAHTVSYTHLTLPTKA
ncbi:hypothetical protein JMUB7542_28070 [Staphylococcus aureus]